MPISGKAKVNRFLSYKSIHLILLLFTINNLIRITKYSMLLLNKQLCKLKFIENDEK